MRRTRIAAAAVSALTAATLVAPMGTADAGSAATPKALTTAAPGVDGGGGVSDNLTRPWQRKYQELQQAALQAKLRGEASGKVVQLSEGQFVETEEAGADRIFVILAEFGSTEHSAYPDGESNAQRVNGPWHNQIPRPDRTVDNSTLWKRDYDRAHYRHMYFDRMRRYYEHQSSGRYSVEGNVTEWVRVPFNQARYGRNDCGGIVCNNTWFLIRDAMAYWVDGQLADGRTMRQIRRYLKTFDHQDRYDFDADGNFAEPDGYIDHMQVVHAGGDEAAGDPVYGEDAIWSHRWYAQVNDFGTGPNGGAAFGGVNAGEGGVEDPDGSAVQVPDHKTGVWIGDYTIQPENGGLGVFAHEFGHDLGLPDLYDTSGNTGGAENSTGFWSLMSSGSNIGRATDAGIGNNPVDLGAWEKFQLGWLDYQVARAGRRSEHRIEPLSARGRRAEALITLLPDKKVPLLLGEPCGECGERYYYSEAGDDIENTMTRTVDGGGPLTAKVRYDIEAGYDYAFLEVSSDGGTTWEPVETNVSYSGEDGSGDNLSGAGISGTTDGQWVNLTATVPAGADAIRFRYVTDSAVTEAGFQVDNITLDGVDIGTAESGAEGWAFDGFRTTTGSETLEKFNAYVVENRQYVGYDRSLRSAYNFGFLDSRPDWVEHYPYQNGMLVNYWDESQSDNNVGDHPGSGLVLPVDAHPTFHHMPDGTLVRPRILSYDSTFGREQTDRLTLHHNSERYRVPSQDAVPVFDDRRDYWYDSDEHGEVHLGRYQPGWYGVDVPKTGTKIKVMDVGDDGVMTIKVGTAR